MTAAAMPTSPGTYMRRAPGWEKHGWTPGPNALIRDVAVEWDAKGAYMWVASHQELIFQLDAEKLAAAGPRGRNHAYEMLRCLEFHGWLTRSRYRASDGRGTVHIWDLHPLPVPPAERTWKPSKAEIRAGYTAPDGSAMPPMNADTLAVESPELPDGRKFRKADIAGDETAAQPGTPERPGTPDEVPPGNPDRPGTDRPGFPFTEENTREENQGGDSAEDVTSDPSPSEQPPTPSLTRNIDDPTTWLCDEHLANPVPVGAPRPSCPPCGDVRRRAEAWVARAGEREAERAAELAAACQWHDESLGVVDPSTGAPFAPAWKCDHTTTSPEFVAAQLAARAEALAPEPREVGEAVARACESVGWRPKPAPPRPPRGVRRRGASVPAAPVAEGAAVAQEVESVGV